MPEKSLKGKKIAMVISFLHFRDAEYFVPKEILEKAGAEITTFSNKKGIALGADGGEVKVDALVSELNPIDFDVVIFVGGPGCLKYLDNEESYRVAKETVFQEKILAAICIAPVILAKANVLDGKKATVWNSVFDKTPIKILQDYGAIRREESVVVDGRIVTANGPAAAKEFAQAIIELVE